METNNIEPTQSQEPTLKEKTAKGLFWGGFSNIFQQLISFGFGIYFARTLNDTDYGIVGMLAIFTGIASALVNSGFGVALINKQDATDKDYNAVFWFTLFVGLFLYIALYFCAPLIAQFYRQPALINLSRVIFIGFFIGGIGTASSAIMVKQMKTKLWAMTDVISLLTASLVTFIMVFKGFGYWSLAIQSLLNISLVSLLRIIIITWKPTFSFNFAPLKPMLSFSIKIFLTSVTIKINENIFSALLGRFYTKSDVGNYVQGQKWMGMGQSFVGGMVTYVTQPVLAQVNEDKERQVNILRKLIRFGAFVSFPLMLGLAFIGREFIIIAVTEKWLPALPYLQLFCVWGAIGFLSTILINLIYTLGKSDIYLKVTIITCVLQLLTIVSLFRLGIFAMIIGYIVMNYMGILLWQYYANKLIELKLKDILKDIFPYLGITLLCFGIVWFITRNIQNLYLLLASKIIISGILYIFALKISNSVIYKESMEFLMNRIKK